MEGWEKYTEDEQRRAGFELGSGKFTVRAIRVKGLGGTLSWPTQPDCIFAHELAGRIRVIAGLDQRPILLHCEKWPDYHRSLQELRKVRAHLNCNPEDGIVLVWGPDEDTVTAANEVRLRYIDAINGIPNETRQPFADGMHRLRADPAGARPHVPGHRQPASARDARARRAAAGGLSPQPVGARGAIRGGRRADVHRPLPDSPRGGAAGGQGDGRVPGAGEAGVRAVRRALEGLRRAGVAVDAIADDAVVRVLRTAARHPVLWEAWETVVRAMAAAPRHAVAVLVERSGSARRRRAGASTSARASATRGDALYSPGDDRLFRFSMGLAMGELRGKVPAREVVDAVRTEIAAR